MASVCDLLWGADTQKRQFQVINKFLTSVIMQKSCVFSPCFVGDATLAELCPLFLICPLVKDWKNFIGALVLKIIYLVICTWDEAGPHTDLQKSSKNINTYFLTKMGFTKYTYCTCLTLLKSFSSTCTLQKTKPQALHVWNQIYWSWLIGPFLMARLLVHSQQQSEGFFKFYISFQTLFPLKMKSSYRVGELLKIHNFILCP